MKKISVEDRVALISVKIGPEGVEEAIDIFEVDKVNQDSHWEYLEVTFIKGPGTHEIKELIPRKWVYDICPAAYITSMLEQEPFEYEILVLEDELDVGRHMIKEKFLADAEHCRKLLVELTSGFENSVKNAYPAIAV